MDHRLDLHHIQRGIILQLATQSPSTFTELQPPRVPNNTFSYHLKRLLQMGYIEPSSSKAGYIPTRRALKIVNTHGQSRSRVGSPSIVTMFYITNSNEEVLLLNRNISPFQGWYGLPSGAVHLGESIDDAAHRELYEKTGIQAVVGDIHPQGVIDFQYREEGTGDLSVHAIAFVYSYHYDDDKLVDTRQSRFGQLSWSRLGRQYILPEVAATREVVSSETFERKSVQFTEPRQVLSL